MVVVPWHVPSGRRTHTLAVTLLLALGIWNISVSPVLLQTGDLNWNSRGNGGEKGSGQFIDDRKIFFFFF